MMQFNRQQNTAYADAATCAPADCAATCAGMESGKITLDTAMFAVSFFVILVVGIIGLVLRISLLVLVLMITGLLVWGSEETAKSKNATCPAVA